MISTLVGLGTGALGHKFFGSRKPLVLSVSVTSRCNLRCSYCYSQKDNQHAKDVPLAEVTRIIDEFHALGTRVVMLQGGEPLLHQELLAMVRYAKGKGLYCAVTSNGSFVERQLEALSLVDQVQLSIDGNQEITDRNRGRGVYAGLIRAMEQLSKRRIPFHLHTVVTNETTEENTLEPLLALAERYGTYLNFCFPAPTGAAQAGEETSNRQVGAFYRSILSYKERGFPINNSRHGLRDIVDWTGVQRCNGLITPQSPDAADYPRCIMGDLVCWLDSEGMLHPCAVRFGQEEFSHSIRGEGGAAAAWEKLSGKPCRYCANSTEFNNLFNFRLESVVNSLKFLTTRHHKG